MKLATVRSRPRIAARIVSGGVVRFAIAVVGVNVAFAGDPALGPLIGPPHKLQRGLSFAALGHGRNFAGYFILGAAVGGDDILPGRHAKPRLVVQIEMQVGAMQAIERTGRCAILTAFVADGNAGRRLGKTLLLRRRES